LLLAMRAAMIVLALSGCAEARFKRQAYGYDAPVVAAAPVVATTAVPAVAWPAATAAPVAEWAAQPTAFSTAAPVVAAAPQVAATVAPAAAWPAAPAVAALPAGWPAAAAGASAFPYSFPVGHPFYRGPYAGYSPYGFSGYPYGAAAPAALTAAYPYGTTTAAYSYGGYPYGAAYGQPAPFSPYGNFGYQGLPYQGAYPWGLGGYNWGTSAALPTVAAAAAPAAAAFPAGSEVSGENVTVSPVKEAEKK
ncbi:hypothetical protein PENTCL1PPCAC_18800, partial [Pristionchus entomophagus]